MNTPMYDLIESINNALEKRDDLPFSIYTSVKEQHLLNVPLVKPTLIFVLSGEKRLGKESGVVCTTGEFVLFGGGIDVDMRNIPGDSEYYALLIEFEFEDFEKIRIELTGENIGAVNKADKYLVGEIGKSLELLLQQYVQWSLFAPTELCALRKVEFLQVLYHLGYTGVVAMAGKPNLSRRVHQLIKPSISEDISAETVCTSLAMSESTLRRKLKMEHTSFQELKDNVTLGQGLHLLQSTQHPISYIAAECGYQSQSRFTQRFKDKFGLTPTELRKTRH